jgi:hypothetical protein
MPARLNEKAAREEGISHVQKTYSWLKNSQFHEFFTQAVILRSGAALNSSALLQRRHGPAPTRRNPLHEARMIGQGCVAAPLFMGDT